MNSETLSYQSILAQGWWWCQENTTSKVLSGQKSTLFLYNGSACTSNSGEGNCSPREISSLTNANINFSEGWRSNFQKCFNVRSHALHGEAASVD